MPLVNEVLSILTPSSSAFRTFPTPQRGVRFSSGDASDSARQCLRATSPNCIRNSELAAAAGKGRPHMSEDNIGLDALRKLSGIISLTLVRCRARSLRILPR